MADRSGLSLGMLYRLISVPYSGNRHMGLVLQVVMGLSRIVDDSAEDLFVEYILGEVEEVSFIPEVYSFRSWLDHYKGSYLYQEVGDSLGVDNQIITNWNKERAKPSDGFFRWLLESLEKLCGHSRQEMCRSYFRMVVRLE
tara:strand:+ start:3576 stop:3998 length:423 start_codon:yes stop_codon:yes gene_type:complete